MKNYILTAIVLVSLLLSGCDTNAGTTSISVNETAAEITETTQETIRMNNCGGKGDAKQTSEKSKSINIEFSGSLGVDKIVVNGEVSAKYNQVSGDAKKIELVAPAKTNMEFVIVWTEKTWVGFVTAQGKDGQDNYKVSVPISVELISSKDLENCSTSENPQSTSSQPETPTPSNPEPTPLPTNTVIPTVSVPQDTPAGTILLPGQAWVHNGKSLTFQRYEFASYPGIHVYWLLENLSSNPITMNMSENDFNAINNLGQGATYKRFYDTFNGDNIALSQGDSKSFSVDLWLDYTNTSINEITVTVSLSDFPNAQWRITVNH